MGFEESVEEDTYYRHDLATAFDIDYHSAELNDGILEGLLPKLEVAERHTIRVA